MIKSGGMSESSEKQASLAISKWENGKVDPEPILITAVLHKPVGGDEVYLGLAFSDENKDVCGVGIQEIYIGLNQGQDELEEIYPVFAPGGSPMVSCNGVSFNLVPINLRSGKAIKNDVAWQKYLELDVDDNVENIMDVLPEIWISPPEPNKIDVWIWIYDKSGHQSEPIKVKNLLPSASEESKTFVEKTRSPGQPVRYFRYFALNELPFRPDREITNIQVEKLRPKSRYCEGRYDNTGRLDSSLRYYHGNVVRQIKYFYDSNNMVEKCESTNPSDPNSDIIEYYFDDKEKLIKTVTLDNNGNIVKED